MSVRDVDGNAEGAMEAGMDAAGDGVAPNSRFVALGAAAAQALVTSPTAKTMDSTARPIADAFGRRDRGCRRQRKAPVPPYVTAAWGMWSGG